MIALPTFRGVLSGFSPLSLAPALWLDAESLSGSDGTQISTWSDRSGNGRDATQATSASQPKLYNSVLNGKKVVRFDGSDDFMEVAHNAALNIQTSGGSVFVAFKKSAGFRIMQKISGFGGSADSWFSNDATNLSIAGAFTNDYATNENAWTILSSTWDLSRIAHWKNGQKQTPTTVSGGTIVSGEIDPTNTPTSNTDNLFIGKRDNPSGTSGIMTGDIAEILIFPTALTTTNRQRVERYLGAKYAITVS